MAVVASNQSKSGMVVQDTAISPVHEGLKSTSNDRRDMWRMGKVQELRVSGYSADASVSKIDNFAALLWTMGYSGVCLHSRMRMGICDHVRDGLEACVSWLIGEQHCHLVVAERRSSRSSVHVPRMLHWPGIEHPFARRNGFNGAIGWRSIPLDL